MHWSLEQVLWALIFAGHLVLLIVLLGRDRNKRFPWFTAAVSISAVRLLIDHLLYGKLTTIAFYWQNYSLLLVSSIVAVFVLVELVRPVFGSEKGDPRPKLNGWLGWPLWSLAVVVLAAAAVVAIGPWPSWASVVADKNLFALRLVWIVALKAELLAGLLAVEVTILLVAFGRRFGSVWTRHPTLIAIGLSTISISQYTVQFISQSIVRNAHQLSEDQRVKLLHVLTNLDHAREALWIMALAWWIVWLWRDEGGRPADKVAAVDPEPLQAAANSSELPTLEMDIPADHS
jgi:hypothetical protein